MLRNNFINNLLNLKDVFVKNIVNGDDFVEFHVETKKKSHVCPSCGSTTSKVHDYRTQKIKDVPIQNKK
ncbi:zinc-finger of transposase IS204/IS1001/IS1096/IS1165, partial [Caloramator fervidus]